MWIRILMEALRIYFDVEYTDALLISLLISKRKERELLTYTPRYKSN
jgi:hypothetical protein